MKNGADDARYDVLYKRPTDLTLKSDVKICCNLLVCDMFDEGASLMSRAHKSPAPLYRDMIMHRGLA